MITFSRSVGTSPGTTVLLQNNGPLGIQQCRPVPLPIHVAPDQSQAAPAIPSAGTRVMYDPYPNGAALKSGGLGIVLTPWEINRTLPNGHPYLQPFDPQYITRGERGYYYDTPLGGTRLGEIPTDAEYATNICYTPVKSGWIYAGKEGGYIPPPYVPPDEWRPVAPQFGPPTSLTGPVLGVAHAALGSAAGQLNDATEELAKHQRRMFYLSIISTAAIAAVAITTIIKASRDEA